MLVLDSKSSPMQLCLCRLTVLEGVPWLPSLQALYLQANSICRIHGLHGLPSLVLLNLASNPLICWKSLLPLSLLPSLRRLDLSGCPLELMEGSGILYTILWLPEDPPRCLGRPEI